MTTMFGDLKVGERARVVGFENGDIAHRQKLLSLGLTPGAEFTVERAAPFGDPVEVRVRETSLSLRKSEASTLLIERVSVDRGKSVASIRTLKLAMIGNPNTGKSTLFNSLTGAQQHVGNWPGVTVEKKVGLFRLSAQDIQLVDLPGVYSLDSYDEAAAVDERIAQDYILSGEADLIINILDAVHLERNLYLTTQLLEMGAPLIVVLNIMEEEEGYAQFDVAALELKLGCPVIALVATKRRDAERLKIELARLLAAQTQPAFAIAYPPLIERAIADLAHSISTSPQASRFNNRWLAIRLLERDAFASHAVDAKTRALAEQLTQQIAQETGDETDVLIANCRYRLIEAVAEKASLKRLVADHGFTSAIDRVVLNRALGIPIFLGVMYCLFWFTIQLSRAFKPFVNQLSDTFFVEGFRECLASLSAPAWLAAILADGLGGGVLQVVNFLPVIGFLYIFLSALEESGYMARANFVMDRMMRALGLPGNAFVPMVVGFGCNVPAIMATRTLERPRDRIVAVLMSPFMSCGGRLAVYTVFAAAFFPEHGHLVIFGVYLLGVLFAILTALIMKNSMLPQERSLNALELPPYHWPKMRNVLINAWIRVKVFVFRVGKFIIPMVLVLKVLSAWGVDGSFNQQPIDRSMLAAGGKALTPLLVPMGVREEQWPATVALLTGVLHKVVIVTTLDSIYLESRKEGFSAKPPFNMADRIKKAAATIPRNLKALVGIGSPARAHGVDGELTSALAGRFDGVAGALAYLILLLCYPCIATTAATTRETNQRWTGFMVFWTLSLGYGMAVLFYQIGTFDAHPLQSVSWALGVVSYFALLGAIALAFAPLAADATPSLWRKKSDAPKAPTSAPNRMGVVWPIAIGLLTIMIAGVVISRLPTKSEPQKIVAPKEEAQLAAPMQAEADPSVAPQTEAQRRVLPVTRESPIDRDAHPNPNLASDGQRAVAETSVEAHLLAFLEKGAAPPGKITWFDFDQSTFGRGKTRLQPTAQRQLQKIAKILNAYPRVNVVISGYADNLGDTKANRRLGKARAAAVARELVKMGVAAARLQARSDMEGLGVEAKPSKTTSIGIIREPHSVRE